MKRFLSQKQREELLEELKQERVRRYADRLRVILLLDDAKTYKSISEHLFLDQATIANYRRRYLDGGIEVLINDDYLGRKAMLSPKDMELLSRHLQSKIFANTKSVIAHIKKKFGVVYSRSGVTKLLDRLGFSFKKATPVPGKADRTKQKAFIEQYKGFKPHGLIYFADASHPEYAPSISYGWIKRGKKFEVKTPSGWRKRVNIIGAVQIESLDIVTRTYSSISKDSVCELLKEIRKRNALEEKIYVILDGAAYNRARKVRERAKKLGIDLIYLPAYSPNLNVTERLWKFMKKKVTANTYYEGFDDFKNALTSFFRGIRKYKNELETLMTDNFPILGT